MTRRIALVIHSLDGGGAEHTVAQMAKWWVEHGEEVILITLDNSLSDRYEVPAEVERHSLDVMGESRMLGQRLLQNRRRVHELRSAIRKTKPDVVVSYTDKVNVLTLLARRSIDVPVVVAERIDPHHHQIGRVWSMLRRWLYARADAVVVQTNSAKRFVHRFVRHDRLYVIPNCIWSDVESESRTRLLARPKQILAVGRLVSQKGFDLLLTAISKIGDDHTNWKLVIAGDGPEREALLRRVNELQLQDRVELVGRVDDLASLYDTSQIFVLPSRYEGFPNVLLEAMAAGLAVISFDCPSGPAEIIRPSVDGLLVAHEDINALSTAIVSLIDDDERRSRLGKAATEVVHRFGVKTYFDQWHAVLDHVMGDG